MSGHMADVPGSADTHYDTMTVTAPLHPVHRLEEADSESESTCREPFPSLGPGKVHEVCI